MVVLVAGHRAVEMVNCPAIQEQPLHTAIAHARDSNRVLQEASVLTQATAQQRLLMQFLGLSSAAGSQSSSTTGGAQHAQQGSAAERSLGSASSSQQQASGSADAQHAQSGQKFESAEAKRAQQGADAPAEQLPDEAGEGRLGQTDKASPAQHDGDHSQHHEDHAQLNGERAHGGQQAADAQASTSTSPGTESNGASQQHSTTPKHSTPPSLVAPGPLSLAPRGMDLTSSRPPQIQRWPVPRLPQSRTTLPMQRRRTPLPIGHIQGHSHSQRWHHSSNLRVKRKHRTQCEVRLLCKAYNPCLPACPP